MSKANPPPDPTLGARFIENVTRRTVRIVVAILLFVAAIALASGIA